MELRKTFIYRYRDGGDTPLCVYLCDTQTKNRILVVPLTNIASENTYKLSVTNQYADLNHFKEINKDDIIRPLFLNSTHVRVSTSDLITLEVYVIKSIMDIICNNAFSVNTSLQLFESIYQFLSWKRQKLLLNYQTYQKKTDIYENGIYWASLGVNIGSELNKNRPVLIWKKRCSGNNEENFSYIVIPITSKEKNKRYYMNVPIDINGKTSYLRIEDMHRINIKRISRPILDSSNAIIFIDNDKRKEIIDAIQKFYIFDNKHKKP
jgi:mRNA-degrading endonuclease toxin of MazEF toxin-antitoxin module